MRIRLGILKKIILFSISVIILISQIPLMLAFSETIPIPNAKVWQSSFYGLPLGPIPTAQLCQPGYNDHPPEHGQLHGKATNRTLPGAVYFSQYLMTDENGTVVTKIMFGRIYVCVNDVNGFLNSSTHLPLREGESAGVNLMLNRTGAIVGTVHDKQGNPIAGVKVGAGGYAYLDEDGIRRCEAGTSDVTGYDGTFVLANNIDSCDYRVTASQIRYGEYSWSLNSSLEKDELADRILRSFKEPPYDQKFNYTTIDKIYVERNKIIFLDITLEPLYEKTGTIVGRLVDNIGKPMPHVEVVAVSNEGDAWAITDILGNFVIRNIKIGTYRMEIHANPEFVVKTVNGINVQEGEEVNVGNIAVARSAAISGKIALSDGTPLVNSGIKIDPIFTESGYADYWPCPFCIATPLLYYVNEMRTDSEGRYNVTKALPPGRYEITVMPFRTEINGKLVETEPKSTIVDAYSGKETKDANLVLDYKIIEDYNLIRSIRFYGYVKDNEGEPVADVTVGINPFFNGSDAFRTKTDNEGFYNLRVTEKNIPGGNNLNWTLAVDASNGNMIELGPSHIDPNNSISVFYEDERVKDIPLDWGSERRMDFTLQKFYARDVLTSNIKIQVQGEAAKYSLPSKTLILNAEGNGRKYDVYIRTNSTLVGSWIDSQKNSLIIEIDPITGTFGKMDLEIPKAVIDGVQNVLFDGQPREASISSNSTHTKVSLNYYHDSKRIEMVGSHVIPEFPLPALVTALSILAIVIMRKYRQAL